MRPRQGLVLIEFSLAGPFPHLKKSRPSTDAPQPCVPRDHHGLEARKGHWHHSEASCVWEDVRHSSPVPHQLDVSFEFFSYKWEGLALSHPHSLLESPVWPRKPVHQIGLALLWRVSQLMYHLPNDWDNKTTNARKAPRARNTPVPPRPMQLDNTTSAHQFTELHSCQLKSVEPRGPMDYINFRIHFRSRQVYEKDSKPL